MSLFLKDTCCRFLAVAGLLGVITLGTHTPSFASNQAVATAQSTDHPLSEELIVLSQLSQNTPLNQNQSTKPQSTKATDLNPPIESTAVSHDKLILNTPVIDEAKLLSDSEKAHLSNQLRRIYEDKLAQMALVIIPSTQGMPIFDYAHAVATRWGLGQQDTDNGILMLVAVNDRNLYIVTGYGVEGVLPDIILKRIIREDISPSFKAGQFAQGLSAGIARIDERLRADPDTLARADQATNTQDNDEQPNLVGLLIMAVVAGGFLNMILGRFLGASIATGGFVMLALGAGVGFLNALFVAFILWLFLLIFVGRGGGFGGGGFGGSSGGFGGGSFGGGGFGSGGYSGGGGSFGGGGAGGSW